MVTLSVESEGLFLPPPAPLPVKGTGGTYCDLSGNIAPEQAFERLQKGWGEAGRCTETPVQKWEIKPISQELPTHSKRPPKTQRIIPVPGGLGREGSVLQTGLPTGLERKNAL